MWKEYPVSTFGINKGKYLNNKGELILCTALGCNGNGLVNDKVYGAKDLKSEADKITVDITIFTLRLVTKLMRSYRVTSKP